MVAMELLGFLTQRRTCPGRMYTELSSLHLELACSMDSLFSFKLRVLGLL
jgi:hypothetical protein